MMSRLSLKNDMPLRDNGRNSGIQATIKKLGSLLYWKKLSKDVKTFVRKCDVLWQDVSMDFIDGLPSSHRKLVILVVVDRLTRYALFIALSHPYTTVQVAQVFLDHVYKLHGMPATIDSDRDKMFGVLHESPTFHIPYIEGSSSVDLVDRTSLVGKIIKFAKGSYLNRGPRYKMKIKADKHRNDKEFAVGDWVYLKLQSYRQLIVRQDYAKVHPVFHISQLKKCQSEDVHMGTFLVCTKQGVLAEEPLVVLDRRMQKKGNQAVVYLLI
ncbi:retrotransposon-related protein [Tanacetum coccineum]